MHLYCRVQAGNNSKSDTLIMFQALDRFVFACVIAFLRRSQQRWPDGFLRRVGIIRNSRETDAWLILTLPLNAQSSTPFLVRWPEISGPAEISELSRAWRHRIGGVIAHQPISRLARKSTAGFSRQFAKLSLVQWNNFPGERFVDSRGMERRRAQDKEEEDWMRKLKCKCGTNDFLVRRFTITQ